MLCHCLSKRGILSEDTCYWRNSGSSFGWSLLAGGQLSPTPSLARATTAAKAISRSNDIYEICSYGGNIWEAAGGLKSVVTLPAWIWIFFKSKILAFPFLLKLPKHFYFDFSDWDEFFNVLGGNDSLWDPIYVILPPSHYVWIKGCDTTFW
ncbi:unnamed protein product, partial [Cuscuta epithymum]